MNNLCIIPARGGSKRIPGKNIKNFLDKPIIAYSIETALRSKLFDEIMVSTDDLEIAKTAKKYGASVPFIRSKKNSDDFAILNDVYEEVISSYNKLNVDFDHVCIILPTAPLITIENLHKSYEIMLDNNFDSVRPVVKFSYPIQRAYKMVNSGKLEFMQPKYYESRSQDLEPSYHDSGQFYWIYKGKNLLDSNKGAIVISELEAQDIDNETDWKITELKYKLIQMND